MKAWSEDLLKACKAFSEEHDLPFTICAGTLTTFAGWKSEEREATEEEQQLWRALGGPT